MAPRTDSLARRPLSSWRRLVVAVAALACVSALALAPDRPSAAGPGSPNIIFFLTDDMTADELSVMPSTNTLLTAGGVSFTRAYNTYPLCCPSRATYFTGRYMHNHATRGNTVPFGGAKRYESLGHESSGLAPRLKTAGYRTAHVGKYLNGYAGGDDCGEGSQPHVPPGWDWWYGKMAKTGGACSENNYYQYSLYEREGPTDNTPIIKDYGTVDAEYQTDVYRDKALGVLTDELPGNTPLYMTVAFGAPHGPFEPAPRHKFLLSATVPPNPPGFDEANISDKPGFIRNRATHRLTSNEKANITTRRQRRLEMLLGVDEAIANVINKVNEAGELNNTYFIFASDNGFFNGEHRIGSGKYLPYEPSSKTPMLIRGPGLPTGVTTPELVGNIDFLPTVLEIAGAAPDPGAPVDGRSMLPFARSTGVLTPRALLLEGDTGPGIGPGQVAPDTFGLRGARTAGAGGKRRPPGKWRKWARKLGLTTKRGVDDLNQEPGSERYAINGNINVPAFRGIKTNRYVLVIYATGEMELYDMVKDPAQLTSQHANQRYAKVRKNLLRRLLGLSFCYGAVNCDSFGGVDPKPAKKVKGKKKKKKP